MTDGPAPVVQLDLSSIGGLFSKSIPSKPNAGMAERDAAGLPYTQKEQITALQCEYEEAAQHGGREAVEKCFK